MVKNRKSNSDINRTLSSLEKKYILTGDKINELMWKREGEIILPVSIFNEKLGMLESASLYLKDELGLSFNQIAGLLKREYRTVLRSYHEAKKKTGE